MTDNFKRIVSSARKRLHNREKQLGYLNSKLPLYQISLKEPIFNLDTLFTKTYKSYILEIGFGDGDNIINSSLLKKDSGHIGCEVFTAGVIDTVKKIEEHNLKNIKIWYDDALELLKLLPEKCLDLVYILHPDPWPKSRHKKRRLISQGFLELLAEKITPTSKILIITDHQDYAEHIKEVILLTKNLYEQTTDYPPIVKTKYRLKADLLGIESQYFCLKLK